MTTVKKTPPGPQKLAVRNLAGQPVKIGVTDREKKIVRSEIKRLIDHFDMNTRD